MLSADGLYRGFDARVPPASKMLQQVNNSCHPAARPRGSHRESYVGHAVKCAVACPTGSAFLAVFTPACARLHLRIGVAHLHQAATVGKQ